MPHHYEDTTGICTSIVSFGNYKTAMDILIAADHLLYVEKAKKEFDGNNGMSCDNG